MEQPFKVQAIGVNEELKLLIFLQEHILGTLPEFGPQLLSVSKINSTTDVNTGAVSAFFKLEFNVSDGGVMDKLAYEIELLWPEHATDCPLFLTQWNHRGWALTGLSRGYCSVVYPGSDVRDAAPLLQKAYPKATMMLIIARAKIACMTLDMFFKSSLGNKDIPAINQNQVCITGHSRNGKQSLIAAAMDERFAAVVGSSPGAPIASPYHLSSHNFYGEGPDAGQAGHWWLASTKEYAAHPEKLPVDGNGILASIAPRRAAIANGWTDHEGDISYADEANVRSSMQVYKLLGAEDNLTIIHRPGDHHGFLDVSSYFDFFDHGFGRLNLNFDLAWTGQTSVSNPFALSYLTPAGFDWSVWKEAFIDETPSSPSTESDIKERVSWLLQIDAEPRVHSKGATYGESSATGTFRYIDVMMARDFENWHDDIKRQPLSFGSYVTANFYWSTLTANLSSCATVIWSHPYSYATGYVESYIPDSNVVVRLASAGYCVLAFDHIGFSTRIREGGSDFYARYGNTSSLFGRMVKDVHDAVDALMCMTKGGRQNGTLCGTGSNFNGPYLPFPASSTPILNPDRIIAAGYSLGGNVAIHAAALDERISGVAAFNAFTPMRSDEKQQAYWRHKKTVRVSRSNSAPWSICC